MKNHRFLWLRNRTTDNRKCEKARNIKEKRTIEMFSTVSRPPAALPSSASADHRLFQSEILLKSTGIFMVPVLFLLIKKAFGRYGCFSRIARRLSVHLSLGRPSASP